MKNALIQKNNLVIDALLEAYKDVKNGIIEPNQARPLIKEAGENILLLKSELEKMKSNTNY